MYWASAKSILNHNRDLAPNGRQIVGALGRQPTAADQCLPHAACESSLVTDACATRSGKKKPSLPVLTAWRNFWQSADGGADLHKAPISITMSYANRPPWLSLLFWPRRVRDRMGYVDYLGARRSRSSRTPVSYSSRSGRGQWTERAAWPQCRAASHGGTQQIHVGHRATSGRAADFCSAHNRQIAARRALPGWSGSAWRASVGASGS